MGEWMLDLDRYFAGRGAQLKVAEYLVRNGLRVTVKGELLAGEVEVTQVSVANACKVDRRVVKSTLEYIKSEKNLMKVYSNLAVIPSLRDLAPVLGFGAIEIIPDDAAGKGIVAAVTSEISSTGMGIRQVIADDPMFDNPELTVVTEKPIPRNLIDRLLKISGVKKIVVLS
ncbi:MAG: amino acid-binding protein [Candidatus Altiarchaeota archaeon]|nr:amino acid-binding protein [Candidatus Altiarchaeota archaeon]